MSGGVSNRYTVSERWFALDGVLNMRDFGGYKTGDGAFVRRGRLFRSGRLSALTQSDIDFINSLELHSIYDFRTESEAAAQPTGLGPSSRAIISHLPIKPGNYELFMRQLKDGTLTVETALENMKIIYRSLALEHAGHYYPVLRHMREIPLPLLIHCNAGKDRTGVCAANILSLLGVDRNTIMEDYLLTRRYYPPAGEFESVYTGFQLDEDIVAVILDAKPEYLQSYFDAIGENFSSNFDYFEKMFDLGPKDQDAIRMMWLE